ncbi:hypothetical protein LJC35_02935, partial [Parabacteroides sp. OttesenSCG-928-N08]|nr:hypothetical protein [Parabacteroides sp. OttesenSCG-928-N08]
MKKKTLLRYGNCLLAAILSVIAFQANAETFTSLPAGGKWHEAATWDKGKAPTNNDDVVIASRVESVSSYLTTHHLTIRPEGQLTGSAWVTVNGNFVNNGDFSGEKSNYFRLLVRGNFENNGSLFMGWVDLQGGDKNIKITQAMQIDYLEVEMDQGSRLTAISDLTFCNTRVRQEKEGVRLVMGSHSLTIKSDKLTYDNYYALFGIPGALMITTEFDDGGRIILDKGMLYNYAGRTAIYGDVVIESPSVAFFSKNLQFFGNLTIAEGTTLVGDKSLATKSTVHGDFINYGNICGDPFIVVDDIQSKANAMEFVVYGNAYNYGRFGYIDRNEYFNKLVLVTDGETRRLSGFFNSLLDFRQSADNKTQPGGKVVIDEEIETVKMLELYAPMEITSTGKLHINVALHSPLRINKTLGGSIKNEGVYSYWLSPSMSFYGFKGKEEYGMNITISSMSGEGERSIEVTEYDQQTYPGLPGTVKRWWRISNREGYEHTTAVMRFYYDEALLNGQPEENLKVFQSRD